MFTSRNIKDTLKLAAQKRYVAVLETNERSDFALRSSQTVKKHIASIYAFMRKFMRNPDSELF